MTSLRPVLLFSILVLVSTSALTAQDPPLPITQGKVDIGGRSLALHCLGDGEPTVIVETGLGDAGIPWTPFQYRMAELSRVCVYARAGLGDSDPPGPGPRTVESVVDDLSALLERTHLPGPYVLVGHSLGGLAARRFAARYPERTAGLLLLDPSHEDMMVLSRARGSASIQAFMDAYEEHRETLPKIEGIDDLEAYLESFETELLGDLPLIVLTSTREPPALRKESLPESLHEVFEAAEEDLAVANRSLLVMLGHLHQDIARLSTRGRQENVEEAGHYLHTDQPEVVLEALAELLEAARSP